MDIDDIFSDDQKILLKALSAYISKEIDKSEGIIYGMCLNTVTEFSKEKRSTIKVLKENSEEERDAVFLALMEIFFEKMSLDPSERRRVKFGALQIYERWKEIKRVEIHVEEKELAENIKDIENIDPKEM